MSASTPRLGSTFRAALHDVPPSLRDPAPPPSGKVPVAVAALGAILSGEPSRALALLAQHEGDAASQESSALRHLATVLDLNWWPGDTGAAHGDEAPEIVGVTLSPTGDARTDLHLILIARTHPGLLSLRSIVRAAARIDLDRARDSVPALAQDELRLLQAAAGVDVAAAADLAVELADLHRLAGARHEAERYLDWSRQAYSRLGDVCGETRCQLLVTNWTVAPLTFTDTLGFDLEDLSVERHIPTADEASTARRAYRDARRTFRAAQSDRGVAATLRGEACLGLLSGDPDSAASAERRLRLAAAYARRAGDTAAAMLADVGATVAAVAAGRLSAAVPAVADVVSRWAKRPGSASYGAGLARLVHACGQAWRRADDVERARVCLTLALEMSSRVSGPMQVREVLSDLADLYGDLNSRGPATASYARALAERLDAAGGPDATEPVEALMWLELAHLVAASFKVLISARDPDALALLSGVARRLLARAPAGAVARASDVDLLARMAVQERELEELRGRRTVPTSLEAAADPRLETDVLVLTSESLHDVLDQMEVLEPLFRARRHQHEGEDDAAAALFSTAVERARERGAAGRSLLIVALQAAGAHGEAQAVVGELLAAAPGTSPGDQLSLWASARGYAQAAHLVPLARAAASSPGWRDLTEWGRVLAETGDVDGADALLDPARAAFEERLSRLTRDSFRVSVTDDSGARDLYAMGAAVAYRTGRVGDSWALGDRLRSFALEPLLDDVTARATQTPDRSADLRRWGRASAVWTGAFDLLAASAFDLSRDPASPARVGLEAAQADLDAAERDLERTLPGHLLRQRRPRPPIRLEDVQPLLVDDTVLIEYLVSWDRLLVWALTAEQVVCHDFPYEMPRLSGAARRFHGSCARRQLAADAGARLTEVLLEPVADVLRDHERVIFVPSGPLALVPFHALPFGVDVLGADHVISVLPSASTLRHLAGRPRPDLSRPALVVGDPAYDPARGLRRLPGARAEALRVARRYGVDPLLDADATEDRVSQGMGRSGVIHLATHGLVNADAPTLSSIALAGLDELTVADLMGLPIDADLVVLSACDTGRGDATLGGDVVGLVRGLLASGARHAVVSLWPVDDLSTCVLMDLFASELADGARVADALTAAQRALRGMSNDSRQEAYVAPGAPRLSPEQRGRQRTPRDLLAGSEHTEVADDHPYWWAPFVHVGF